MNNMKKFPIAIIAVVILGASVFAYNLSQAGSVKISEPQEEEILGGQRDVIRMRCGGATGTTTPTYMSTSAASSTCQAFIADATAVDLRFMVNSSTTPSTLTYEYYVTEDDLAERNWFYVDGSTEREALATSSQELIPYKSYHKTDLSATHLRLDYAISGAAADVYVEIVKDNQIK